MAKYISNKQRREHNPNVTEEERQLIEEWLQENEVTVIPSPEYEPLYPRVSACGHYKRSTSHSSWDD